MCGMPVMYSIYIAGLVSYLEGGGRGWIYFSPY